MAPEGKQAAVSDKKPGHLYEEFKLSAEAVAARVDRVADNREAVRKIAEIIKETGAKKVVAACSPLVDSLGLETVLQGAVSSMHCRDLRQNAVDADLGISGFDLAIVETGTLVQDASDIDSRLVSMLPPVHVALVCTEDLVPTLRDALDRYNNNLKALPPYLAFVSGPSRTADIERVLTIGVHGPGELRIIFIDQPGGERQ